MPASIAKGLEFDWVVVVEPAEVVAAEPRGLRRLYVVLTRAVSGLAVVHADPLPDRPDQLTPTPILRFTRRNVVAPRTRRPKCPLSATFRRVKHALRLVKRGYGGKPKGRPPCRETAPS